MNESSLRQQRARGRTRKLVITAILAAISIVLSLTPIGLIPVPTAAGAATILQIPAILAAVFEGPIAGMVVGAVFGVTSFLQAPNPWFKDPMVAIIPRILIGLISYLVYVALTKKRGMGWKIPGLVITGFVGSAVNTIFVLGAVYLFFPVSMKSLLVIAGVQGIPEAIVSAIITTAVATAYLGVTRRGRKSKIS